MEEELYLKIVEPRQHLWWWVREKIKLSEESIVEGVLAFGDMKAVKALLQTMGEKKIKTIFIKQIRGKRCNYRPQTINFFKKVLSIDI